MLLSTENVLLSRSKPWCSRTNAMWGGGVQWGMREDFGKDVRDMVENIGYDVRDKKFFARKKLQRQKSFTLISSYLSISISMHSML